MKYLMSSPEFFGVEYSINPWMDGNKGLVNLNLAKKQWQSLYNKISQYVEVDVLPGVKGLPDMVFTANAGIVKDKKAVVANFKFSERQPESKHFRNYFEKTLGSKNTLSLPKNLYQEGAGDALFDRYQKILWAGSPFRSNPDSYKLIQDFLGYKTVILELVHPEYYHLDISLAPLDLGHLMYCPESFSPESVSKIEDLIPKSHRIILSLEDLNNFNGNAVNIGNLVIINKHSPLLIKQLEKAGYEVFVNDISEFKKAGGGNKCLTLRIE